MTDERKKVDALRRKCDILEKCFHKIS